MSYYELGNPETRPGPGELTDPGNAYSPAYGEVLEGIETTGICPFCPEGLEADDREILTDTEEWIIHHNVYPLSDREENAVKLHLLLTPRRHLVYPETPNPNDYTQIGELVGWATDHFKINGFGLAARIGESKQSGLSILHSHFHLIEPNTDESGRAVPLDFPIG